MWLEYQLPVTTPSVGLTPLQSVVHSQPVESMGLTPWVRNQATLSEQYVNPFNRRLSTWYTLKVFEKATSTTKYTSTTRLVLGQKLYVLLLMATEHYRFSMLKPIVKANQEIPHNLDLLKITI